MRYGATGMQGWRNTMEDAHITELDLGDGVAFFGVYDGHGGKCRLEPINITCLKKISSRIFP
jgi:hypothetical protein